MNTNYKDDLICLKRNIKKKFVQELRLLVIQYNDINSDSDDELLIIPKEKVEYQPIISAYDHIEELNTIYDHNEELNTAFDDRNRSKQLIVIEALLENLIEKLGVVIT